MKICEIILMVAIIIVCMYSIYTDISRGRVENRAIMAGIITGICINAFYYGLFARPFFKLYLLNFFVMMFFSILLYYGRYWAAGDSKLLICLSILIPGRLYDLEGLKIPGISLLIIIFLFAYGYIIIESLISWVIKKKTYRKSFISMQTLPSLLMNYAVIFCFFGVLSFAWQCLFKGFYRSNQILFSFINILIATKLANSKIAKSSIGAFIFIGLFIVSLLLQGLKTQIRIVPILENYGVVLFVLLIRYFVSGYNYAEIATDDVRAGMVLSYSTVLLFQSSRIKNLPLTTHEDMGDRIDEIQADAIKRWGKSKKGNSCIVIVRKIPFAVFIAVGTAVYITIRVVL